MKEALEHCFTSLVALFVFVAVVSPHSSHRGDPSGPREKVFRIFALVVVLLFAGYVFAMLAFAGDDGGHGEGGDRRVGDDEDHDMTGADHGGTDSSSEGHGDGHEPPAFVQSFAFTGLMISGGYLAILALWGRMRGRWEFLLRHGGSAAVLLLLVVLYLNAMGGLAYNGHTWNRAFANASVLLFAVTLAIGPLARLWRPAAHAMAWRRETGIWATIGAVMHVGVFWEWSLDWDWRPFFYPGMHGEVAETLLGDRSADLVPTVFDFANVVGLAALAYALVLTVISNEAFQQWLGRGWSWLQNRATTMWLLLLLHAWSFAYYIEGPATLRSGTLWASFWFVLLLQTSAFIKIIWGRQRSVVHARPLGPD